VYSCTFIRSAARDSRQPALLHSTTTLQRTSAHRIPGKRKRRRTRKARKQQGRKQRRAWAHRTLEHSNTCLALACSPGRRWAEVNDNPHTSSQLRFTTTRPPDWPRLAGSGGVELHSAHRLQRGAPARPLRGGSGEPAPGARASPGQTWLPRHEHAPSVFFSVHHVCTPWPAGRRFSPRRSARRWQDGPVRRRAPGGAALHGQKIGPWIHLAQKDLSNKTPTRTHLCCASARRRSHRTPPGPTPPTSPGRSASCKPRTRACGGPGCCSTEG